MQSLLNRLRQSGELARITKPVDPKFQLAAVTKALQKAGEQAVLFEAVKGSDFPVVSNLYGSHDRLRAMIGAQDQTFCQRWNTLTEAAARATAKDCLTQYDGPDDFIIGKLSDLPAITYHGRDGGPYFTSAIYLANEPETGVPNLSFHRSQQISDTELRVRLGTSHDLAGYQRKAEVK